MTKEEILAQLDLLETLRVQYKISINVFKTFEEYLMSKLTGLKSIQELQKEAFDKGKLEGIKMELESIQRTSIKFQKQAFEAARSSIEGNFNYRYETFEDYLEQNSD